MLTSAALADDAADAADAEEAAAAALLLLIPFPAPLPLTHCRWLGAPRSTHLWGWGVGDAELAGGIGWRSEAKKQGTSRKPTASDEMGCVSVLPVSCWKGGRIRVSSVRSSRSDWRPGRYRTNRVESIDRNPHTHTCCCGLPACLRPSFRGRASLRETRRVSRREGPPPQVANVRPPAADTFHPHNSLSPLPNRPPIREKSAAAHSFNLIDLPGFEGGHRLALVPVPSLLTPTPSPAIAPLCNFLLRGHTRHTALAFGLTTDPTRLNPHTRTQQGGQMVTNDGGEPPPPSGPGPGWVRAGWIDGVRA